MVAKSIAEVYAVQVSSLPNVKYLIHNPPSSSDQALMQCIKKDSETKEMCFYKTAVY